MGKKKREENYQIKYSQNKYIIFISYNNINNNHRVKVSEIFPQKRSKEKFFWRISLFLFFIYINYNLRNKNLSIWDLKLVLILWAFPIYSYYVRWEKQNRFDNFHLVFFYIFLGIPIWPTIGSDSILNHRSPNLNDKKNIKQYHTIHEIIVF